MQVEDQVFLSYAREDLREAERLYMDLRISEINVWMDTKCLLPGQNWKREIRKAIRESTFFLAPSCRKCLGFVRGPGLLRSRR